jgi:hypothetical protein
MAASQGCTQCGWLHGASAVLGEIRPSMKSTGDGKRTQQITQMRGCASGTGIGDPSGRESVKAGRPGAWKIH